MPLPTGGPLDGPPVGASSPDAYPDRVNDSDMQTADGAPKDFEGLYAELLEKARTRPEGSGTVRELDAGVHQIGKKIVEEAAEVWLSLIHI